MTVDRAQAPDIERIRDVKPFQFEKYRLKNNIPLYITPHGDSDLFKLVIRFQGGQSVEKMPLQAQLSIRMLQEGTAGKSAGQIAELLDYFGATLKTSHEKDFSTISLQGLRKDFGNLTELLAEILAEAQFPEKEFRQLRHRLYSQFQTNIRKKAFRAKNEMEPILFGKNHPYGHKITEEAFSELSRDDVLDYYQNYIRHAPFRVFITGVEEQAARDILEGKLGHLLASEKQEIPDLSIPADNTRKVSHFNEDNAFQSAIRLSRKVVNRNHPDFFDLQILNTILGGYFGSRLMKNLREEKGLTYGVGSAIGSTQNTGIWVIATEVGADYTQKALEEIYKEIHRLKTEKIPQDELSLIKNYLPGKILRSLEKDIDRQRAFIEISDHNLNTDYYRHYLKRINEITATEIREQANNYLLFDNISEVVVGKL